MMLIPKNACLFIVFTGALSATAFGAVAPALSSLHTRARDAEGRALTAKDSRKFERHMLEAARLEKKMLPTAVVGGGLLSLLAVLVGATAWASLNQRFNDRSPQDIMNAVCGTAACATAAVTCFANIPAALKRRKSDRLYVKYADLLHGRLPKSSFKNKMGVISWSEAQHIRKIAERQLLCLPQWEQSHLLLGLYANVVAVSTWKKSLTE